MLDLRKVLEMMCDVKNQTKDIFDSAALVQLTVLQSATGRHCTQHNVTLLSYYAGLRTAQQWYTKLHLLHTTITSIDIACCILQGIRKDCFQVKSNLLTDFRFTTRMNIMILN